MKTSSHDTPSQDVEYHCIFFPAKKLQLHPLLVIENLSRLCLLQEAQAAERGQESPSTGAGGQFSCLELPLSPRTDINTFASSSQAAPSSSLAAGHRHNCRTGSRDLSKYQRVRISCRKYDLEKRKGLLLSPASILPSKGRPSSNRPVV